MNYIKDMINAFEKEKDLTNAGNIFSTLQKNKYSEKQKIQFRDFLDFLSSSEWKDYIEINHGCNFKPLVNIWYRRKKHNHIEAMHEKIALTKAIIDKIKDEEYSFEVVLHEVSKEYCQKYETEIDKNGINFKNENDNRWYYLNFTEVKIWDIDFLKEILYQLYQC